LSMIPDFWNESRLHVKASSQVTVAGLKISKPNKTRANNSLQRTTQKARRR
jgi:hypothetical protein